MKKTLLTILFLLSLILSGCVTQVAVCGEGLIEVDGVCTSIDNEEDPDDNDPNPISACNTTTSNYGVSNFDLVWNDEFDYNGQLDSTKWEYMIGNGGAYGIPGWGNGELQYYTNDQDNVLVSDGKLTITASTNGFAQYGYTSGRVRSMGMGDFRYGIIEVCAQLPTTLGTWPAIWMLPTNSPYGGWPTGGEIDIMEAVGYESNTIHFNIHTKNDNWGTSQSIGSYSNISNIGGQYHAYAILWDQFQIEFYVDGQLHFTYRPVQYTYEYWPFDSDFHLLLNIAVGGSWGGARGVQDGPWEDSMFVDYVRVYQER